MVPLASANPLLPLWIVLPLSAVALASIGLHLASLPRAPMPESRRRIRMANGVLLLAITILLTYAIGYIGMLPEGGGSIGHARAFVMIWMSIMALLPLVLTLAGLDMLNTYRLAREARARLRLARHADLLREVEIRVSARLGTAGTSGSLTSGGASTGDDASHS